MTVPVKVTPLARQDVRFGEAYFESKRNGLGTEFVDEVLETLHRIGDLPLGFGEVGNGVRAAGLRRFGYIMYYRSDGTQAEVMAVLHGARNPGIWQSRS